MIKTPLTNTVENYASILQDCGVQVNTDRGVIDCIRCKSKETMSYTMASIVSASPTPWFSCSACRWSGDAFNAWAQVRGLDMTEALEQLRRKKVFYISGKEFDTAREHYLDYEMSRHAINSAWASTSAKTTMHDLSRRELNLLEEYNIATHIDEDWDKSLGSYVGLSRGDVIQDLFSTMSPPTGKEDRPFILAPITDLPGRITRIVVLQKHKGKKFFEVLNILGQSLDGLFGMAAIDLFEDNIYASDELPLVLSLQASSRHMSNLPIPIVGYTPETDRVWDLYPNSNIIFYTPMVTAKTFKSALKTFRNAYITTGPSVGFGEDPEAVLLEKNGRELIDNFYRTKIPVLDCLRDYILNLRSTQVRNFVDTIDMEEVHWSKMMEGMNQDSPEYHTLRSLRNSGAVTKRIPSVNLKSGYLECIDGKINLNGNCVCGAVPTIEKITTFSSHVILEGKVEVDHKIYPFCIPIEEFGSKWLEIFCRTRGHMVNVTTAIRSNFDHYINSFSTPIREEGIDVVGWHPDAGSFIFPNKCINYAGRIEEVTTTVLGEHSTSELELADVKPDKDKLKELFTTDPSNVMYLSAVSCALASVLSYSEGIQCLQVNVKGPDIDRKNLFKRITDEFKFELLEPLRTDNILRPFDNYPTQGVLDSNSTNSAYIQNLTKDRSIFVTMDEGLTRLSNMCGGWVSVLANKYEGVTLPVTDYLWAEVIKTYLVKGRSLPYIKHYTSKDNHITHAVADILLRTICKLGNFNNNSSLLKAVKDNITIDVPTEHDKGKRLIYAILYLIENQIINLGDSLEYTKKAPVIVSDTVHINYKNLGPALKFTPSLRDPSVITQAFEGVGCLINKQFGLHILEGWEIDKDYWDEVSAEWHNLRDC